MAIADIVNNIYSIEGKFNGLGSECVRRTFFYNEDWLLKILLYGLETKELTHPKLKRLFSFPRVDWVSEGMLYTAFKPIPKSEKPLSDSKRGERYTDADGVVGDIYYDDNFLKTNGTSLCIIEAKLGSTLGSKTKNAPGYNQLARTVACLGSIIKYSDKELKDFDFLAVYVIAPEKISGKPGQEYTGFDKYLKSLDKTIRARIDGFKSYANGNLQTQADALWLEANLDELLRRAYIDYITWEDIEVQSNNVDFTMYFKECADVARIKKESKNESG